MTPSVHGVTGYIVNIHDAVNFDIDLSHKFNKVLPNKYSYYDLTYSQLTHLTKNVSIKPREGISYRCRLRGIKFNRKGGASQINLITKRVRQLINKSDGWVTCNLYGTDIYNRVLTDIIIFSENKFINLYNYLLDNFGETGIVESYN